MLRQQQQQQQPDQPRPSSRGDNHSSRGEKPEVPNKDSHRDRNSHKDREPLVKKTNKENKGPPMNAWLKGKPRILEKQEETPVSYINRME